MADLTFQSQQMANEQSNIAGQATMQAASALGAGIERGAQAIQQQANINTERSDRQQQWQEQRQDRARQTDQEAALQNKALDQRAGMFEQEIAQRREEFALAKVREARMAEIDLARTELLRIETEQRKREHEALKAIGEDKLQQQMIQSQELDLREKAARVAMLEREAEGLPTPNAMFQALHDPENQERWGVAVDVNGKARSLTDTERGALRESLGRRDVNRVLETLVKSTAETDPAMSGKFAVIAMKVATGRMSIEEAEQAIDTAQVQAQQAQGIDGARVKLNEPPKDSGPFSGRFLGSDNATKVEAYVKANIPQFKAFLSGGADPRRLEGTDFSDENIVNRIAKIIGNPKHPLHGAIIQGLAEDGMVDMDAYARGVAWYSNVEQQASAFEREQWRQPRMQ